MIFTRSLKWGRSEGLRTAIGWLMNRYGIDLKSILLVVQRQPKGLGLP